MAAPGRSPIGSVLHVFFEKLQEKGKRQFLTHVFANTILGALGYVADRGSRSKKTRRRTI